MNLESAQTQASWVRYRLERAGAELARAALQKELERISKSASPTCQISVRVKTPRSYLGKILTPGKAKGTWPFVDDLIGGRIAFDSAREMKDALRRIKASKAFSTTEVEIKRGANTELYYPGIHIIATLAGATYSDGSPIRCEIQLRTKAQDAWSSVSHKLAYKAGLPISKASQRKIWRLVALMEVFDDEVDDILSKRARNREYKVVTFLEAAEDSFADLTGNVRVGPSRLDIASLLLSTYSVGDASGIRAILDDFVGSQRERIDAAYSKFDPESDEFDANQDWLALQPESLLILERAIHAPEAIALQVVSSALEEPVRSLFHAFDVPWPLDN